MTELIVPVSGNIVEQVLANIDFDTPLLGKVTANYQQLRTPVAIAAAKEVWVRIEKVLMQAALDGWEAVKSEVKAVNAFLEERATELLGDAADFRNLLVQKLRETMQGILDFVLGSIRTRVKIGEDTYALASIDLQSKLVYSSSIEASIATLCKFVASGEVVVTGKYTLLNLTSGN